ncbi:MAG TPA: hypothetical protein PLK31_11380 [Chloroflexota bacterium]|nr:hypothetical protein [Chloroflexota bacterium]
MANQEDTLKQINKSGFPFQLRVEHEIRLTQEKHHWSVASREHPWTSADNLASGFIDIVLRHDTYPTFRLVIECKRVKADDARQLRWIFLLPDKESQPTGLTSCFEVEGSGRQNQIDEHEWNDIRVWDNVHLTPTSLQSEFCILTSDEQRKQPILESLATEVLESIEGLAEEEVNIERSLGQPIHTRLFIFPAIVTNAEIAVCRLDPANIKIADGTLDAEHIEITTVPFIRFRKSLATSFPQGAFHFLEAANKARERPVFIVNAASLPEFLKNWKLEPLPNSQYAISRLFR